MSEPERPSTSGRGDLGAVGMSENLGILPGGFFAGLLSQSHPSVSGSPGKAAPSDRSAGMTEIEHGHDDTAPLALRMQWLADGADVEHIVGWSREVEGLEARIRAAVSAEQILGSAAVSAAHDLLKGRGIRAGRENIADMLAAAYRAAKGEESRGGHGV